MSMSLNCDFYDTNGSIILPLLIPQLASLNWFLVRKSDQFSVSIYRLFPGYKGASVIYIIAYLHSIFFQFSHEIYHI